MKLASIFTDHMVLQADKPIRVFGQGAGTVSVEFLDQQVTKEVTGEEWCITLPAASYGGPYEMKIVLNAEEIVLQDVYLGEVWLAMGQSNMEMPLFRTEYGLETAKHSANDKFRLFTIARRTERNTPMCVWAAVKDEIEDTPWKLCCEESVLKFSAIGYYVAQELQEKLGVAVGVINCSWGGMPIETFIRRDYFTQCEVLRPELEKYQAMLDKLDWAAYQEAFQKELAERQRFFDAITFDEVEEVREKGPQPCIGYPAESMPQAAEGPFVPSNPGCLYDSMVSRIVPFGVRGVLWYQGESNQCDGYLDKYLTFMKSMREIFENDELHFCAAELAAYGYCGDAYTRQNADNRFVTTDNIALKREQQQKATELAPNNYLATSMELGQYNDIHPIHKKSLAHRMALKLLKHTYHQPIIADQPIYDYAEFKDGKAYVHLKHAEGLYCRYLWAVKMYVADERHELKRAQIQIEGDTLALTCSAVPNPTIVRYGFDSYYHGYHIYNKAGLPLAPFRTDV